MRVSTNSEPLTAEDHEAIHDAWGAPLHNLWGSTEIGVQAVGCGHGEGLHVCEDEVILERVDETGAPVAADQPAARTLATGLANLTFPFIRYDLGDEVTLLSEPCPCGSALARVSDIAGRSDDDFRYGTDDDPGKRLPPRARHRPRDLRVPGSPDGRRGRRTGRRRSRGPEAGDGPGRVARALRADGADRST